MFETAPYDCSPCLELIGGQVTTPTLCQLHHHYVVMTSPPQDSGLLEMLNEETLSPRVSSEDIRIRMRRKFKSNDRSAHTPQLHL